jgi:hypothetical protein
MNVPAVRSRCPGRRLGAGALALLGWCNAGAAVPDIPMHPDLAMQRLDSKTCYATLERRGKLVGYELGQLLLSVDGRLAALDPVAAAEVGDGQRRVYTGAGLSVMLVPRTTKTRPGATADEFTIDERASLTVIHAGTVHRYGMVDVRLECSP